MQRDEASRPPVSLFNCFSYEACAYVLCCYWLIHITWLAAWAEASCDWPLGSLSVCQSHCTATLLFIITISSNTFEVALMFFKKINIYIYISFLYLANEPL